MTCPIACHAIQTPETTALYLPEQTISYRQLNRHIHAMQQQLKLQSISAQQHLLITAETSYELILLLWACWREQIVTCPINPSLSDAQQQRLFERTNATQWWPKTIQFDRTNTPADTITAELNFDVLSNLIGTSGSTGEPKLVAHQLKQHIANAQGSLVPISAGDCWLLSLPLYHVGGLAILFRCFLAGAAIALPDRTQPLTQQLSQAPVTHLSLVPTQLYRLLHQPDFHFSHTHVQHLLLGGAPIPTTLIAQCQQQGLTPWVSYGLSEMASQVCTTSASLSGLVGQPLPQRELTIQAGEICVKGETLFAGYYQADGTILCPTDSDGWFHTGDTGHWLNEGLVVEGRIDNQFVSGGENIQPEQIEQILIQHPAVAQAIVVPQRHDEWGQQAVCYLEWHDQAVTIDRLKQWLQTQLARYQIPKAFYPWPELPAGQLKISRQFFKTLAAETKNPAKRD